MNCPDRFGGVHTDTASSLSVSDHFVVCADIITQSHERLHSRSGIHFNYAKADIMIEAESHLLNVDFTLLLFV